MDIIYLVLSFITTTALGGMVAYAKKQLKNYSELNDSVRTLLLSELERRYHDILQYGDITEGQAKMFDALYSSYHGLGGNGYGTKLYTEVMALPHPKGVKNGD